jgi:L-ascorbate metabolism protein UlaG (beta-lactamase superfamily)
MILGSESTANIARGSDVPVDLYQILDFGESRYFGKFTITLLESRHAPLRPNGAYWFPDIIDEPLRQPARINQWQAGATYSLLVSHPSGTTLVQGSAGFIEGNLAGHQADVVMLGIAGLAGLGREYTGRYWRETVHVTGATRVYVIHFDDFTFPFGEVALFPDIIDDVVTAADWLRDMADAEDVPVTVQIPRFGQPIDLY